MKKRTKVLLIVLGSVVLVLALAGVFVTRPPMPYDFLEGARHKGSWVITPASMGMPAGTSVPGVPTEFFIAHYETGADVTGLIAKAKAELTTKPGWKTDMEDPMMGAAFSYTAPSPSGGATTSIGFPMTMPTRGVYIFSYGESTARIMILSDSPTAFDRLQAWVWQKTHPDSDYMDAMMP